MISKNGFDKVEIAIASMEALVLATLKDLAADRTDNIANMSIVGNLPVVQQLHDACVASKEKIRVSRAKEDAFNAAMLAKESALWDDFEKRIQDLLDRIEGDSMNHYTQGAKP